jgi:hypothetical protein
MNAVAPVERLDPRHAFEEKRDKRHVVLLRERWIHLMEVDAVDLPEVRRRLHAGKDHLNAARLGPFDDRREVALQLADRKTAQRIVPAERDHEDADVTRERPVQPAQPAGRRIARDASVDHVELEPLGVDPLLEQAVRLSPRNTTRGRESAADVTCSSRTAELDAGGALAGAPSVVPDPLPHETAATSDNNQTTLTSIRPTFMFS